MQELLISFAFSKKSLKSYIHKTTSYITDKNEREGRKNLLYEMQESYIPWLVSRERDDILRYLKGLSNYLVAALTIEPIYVWEYEERERSLLKAESCCKCLLQELQYISTAIPADKNRYTGIALDLDKELKAIKDIKISDQEKYLPHLKKILE